LNRPITQRNRAGPRFGCLQSRGPDPGKPKSAGLPDKKESGRKNRERPALPKQLEDCHLYVQEFLRILAEVADHQPHIAGEAAEIVVERRIAEELSDRALV
jgi:hypothetical protein